jgi:hypothetical protein
LFCYEVPGLAEDFKVADVAFAGAGGIKTNVFAASDCVHRNDVPGVVGDDVGGEKIDVVGSIESASVAVASNAEVDEVSATMGGECGLHLNAKQAFSGGDHEVEGHAVAVWLANAESEVGGFEHEDKFGEFSFALGMRGFASALARRIVHVSENLHQPIKR